VRVAQHQLRPQQGPKSNSAESALQGLLHPIPETTAPASSHSENVGSTAANGPGVRTAAELRLNTVISTCLFQISCNLPSTYMDIFIPYFCFKYIHVLLCRMTIGYCQISMCYWYTNSGPVYSGHRLRHPLSIMVTAAALILYKITCLKRPPVHKWPKILRTICDQIQNKGTALCNILSS